MPAPRDGRPNLLNSEGSLSGRPRIPQQAACARKPKHIPHLFSIKGPKAKPNTKTLQFHSAQASWSLLPERCKAFRAQPGRSGLRSRKPTSSRGSLWRSLSVGTSCTIPGSLAHASGPAPSNSSGSNGRRGAAGRAKFWSRSLSSSLDLKQLAATARPVHPKP